MILPEEKADLCQVSLTGLRALVMLGLLSNAPRSLEDIRKKFLAKGLIEPENSYDILRIDMNTLRSMGCEISRASSKTDHKHILIKHPYGLKLTQDDIKILKRAYRIVKNCADFEILLRYHKLFKKLAQYVFDEDIKEQLYGISILKSHNTEFLEELANDCREKNTITIEYRDGGTRQTKIKNVVAQKIEMQNDKVYLFGFDTNTQESVMLLAKRIRGIISRTYDPDSVIEQKPVEVKFSLKNFNVAGIQDCEEIIESHDDMSQILKGTYHNEFIAVQRMLELGTECTVLEPEHIRQKVIDKLLLMREIYKND